MRTLIRCSVPAVLLFLSLPDSSEAQQRRNSRPATDNVIVRNREQQERAFALDHIADGTNKPRPKGQLTYTQLREDFIKVQEINNQLLMAASKSFPDGPGAIEKAAAEVVKRAERLRSGLALPPADDSAETEASHDPGDLLSQVKALDKQVTAFVTNPVFKNPQVIDNEQARIASDRLDGIISLSRELKENAQKLKKTKR